MRLCSGAFGAKIFEGVGGQKSEPRRASREERAEKSEPRRASREERAENHVMTTFSGSHLSLAPVRPQRRRCAAPHPRRASGKTGECSRSEGARVNFEGDRGKNSGAGAESAVSPSKS